MPSKLVMMTWHDDDGDFNRPDNSLPWGPGRPSHGLPGGGHVDNSLPSGGHIALLPVFPFDPTRPDGGLPTPPAGTLPIRPGARFIVKWLACQGLILVPDNSLPTTPPPVPGQPLPQPEPTPLPTPLPPTL